MLFRSVVMLVAGAAVASSGCSYNRFVSQEEAIKTQWSQVENQLQRRNDLIPNLVESTKGFAQQERDVFQSIADSRAKLAGAQTTEQKIAAANDQSSALSRLLVVVENYPTLKSDATFARLIEPLRTAGIPLWLALGNHDHRERFWHGVNGAKRVVDGLTDRQAAIVPAGRANWFILDSLDKTNSTPGVLGAAQLRWLEGALDANATKPALVMVHHNPNTGGNKNGLTETEALMEILRPRRQVKAHFFGHSHRWSIERDPSGIHLVNLPATAYPFDQAQPAGWVAEIGRAHV